MTTATLQPGVFTPNEIKDALEKLSQADWIRLERSADYLAWGLAITGDDLLNEIFCRTLEGKRKCPLDLPVVVFLIGAMRSEVSSYLDKRNRDVLGQGLDTDGSDQQDSMLFASKHYDLDSPEEILMAQQTLNRINALFHDDDNAQMVLMGQMDGLSPGEIRAITGLSPVEYASTLKSIRRKQDKLIAEEQLK